MRLPVTEAGQQYNDLDNYIHQAGWFIDSHRLATSCLEIVVHWNAEPAQLERTQLLGLCFALFNKTADMENEERTKRISDELHIQLLDSMEKIFVYPSELSQVNSRSSASTMLPLRS
jgi:hypothetical protein